MKIPIKIAVKIIDQHNLHLELFKALERPLEKERIDEWGRKLDFHSIRLINGTRDYLSHMAKYGTPEKQIDEKGHVSVGRREY